LVTSDGGTNWSSRTILIPPPPGAANTLSNPLFAKRARGIACTDANHCVLGDEAGAPWITQDGFQTVSTGNSANRRLLGGSCGGGGACVLVGEFGATVRTNGGSVA